MGMRFWTFFNAGPIDEIRKVIGKQELGELKTRLAEISPS